MGQKKGRGSYSREFKEDAVRLATKELWRARGCLIGSPTLNNTLLPSVGEFLYNLRGLRPRHRIVSAFGSYGWGGGGVKEVLRTAGETLKLKTVEPGIQVLYRPSSEDETLCYEFGRSFARATREYHQEFK
jgi:flavorubredoxin